MLSNQALKDLDIENPTAPPESPLPFFHLLFRLKATERAGWGRFGVTNCESISDHMYRMAVMTMLAPPSLQARGLDISRCIQMALVHDMAEALVGDITPQDGIPKPEKSRREETTMQFLTEKLLGSTLGGMDQAGKQIMDLWREYEDSETLESKFVHDVDKLELVLQMNEYERNLDKKKDLGEFCRAPDKILLPEVRDWYVQVMKERLNFWGPDFKKGMAGYEEVHESVKACSM